MTPARAVFASFVGVLSVSAADSSDDNGHWIEANSWGSTGGQMPLCGGDERMTGFCLDSNQQSGLRNCDYGVDEGDHGVVECTDFVHASSQVDKKWEIGEHHGEVVECNIKEGFAAVGVCVSGDVYDGRAKEQCQCTGGPRDNCHDDNMHASLLRCAKGLDLVVEDTLQVVQEATGSTKDKPAMVCPPGFVGYRFCIMSPLNSAFPKFCYTELGLPVAATLGCVRVAGMASNDPGYEIEHIEGYWQDLGTYNHEMIYTVEEGVEDARGMSMESSKSSAFGFSQEVSVGISVGWGPAKASADVSVGFTQDFESSFTSSVSSMLTSSKYQSWELPCGGSDTGFETIYQWFYRTRTADNRVGPTIKTRNYLCAEGTPKSPNRPRCAPEYCEDEQRCDECVYDYCEVKAVEVTWQDQNTPFHFNRKCVDVKLNMEEWGKNPKVGQVFTVEHTRRGVIMNIGEATIYRHKHVNATEETEGDAWGVWNGEAGATSEWQVGDQMRVLTFELEETGTVYTPAPSAAFFSKPSAILALFSTLLAALFLTN